MRLAMPVANVANTRLSWNKLEGAASGLSKGYGLVVIWLGQNKVQAGRGSRENRSFGVVR